MPKLSCANMKVESLQNAFPDFRVSCPSAVVVLVLLNLYVIVYCSECPMQMSCLIQNIVTPCSETFSFL